MNKKLPNNDDVLGPVEQPMLGSEYAQQHWKQQQRSAAARSYVDYYERRDAASAKEPDPAQKAGKAHRNDDLFGDADVEAKQEVKFKTPTAAQRAQAERVRANEQHEHDRRVRLDSFGLNDGEDG